MDPIELSDQQDKTPGCAAETPAEKKVRRYSAIEFLIALVLMIVSMPLLDDLRHGVLVQTVLLTVVMLSALPVVGASRRILIPACILVVPAVVSRWANFYLPDLMAAEIHLTAAILFISFIIVRLLRFVLRAPKVNTEVLCAAVSNYLLLGLLWMFAYALTETVTPGAFAFTAEAAANHSMDGFNALYFSFVTLGTVGYGDIVPVSQVARMLAFTEAVTGLFYMAMIVARLVALYSSEKH